LLSAAQRYLVPSRDADSRRQTADGSQVHSPHSMLALEERRLMSSLGFSDGSASSSPGILRPLDGQKSDLPDGCPRPLPLTRKPHARLDAGPGQQPRLLHLYSLSTTTEHCDATTYNDESSKRGAAHKTTRGQRLERADRSNKSRRAAQRYQSSRAWPTALGPGVRTLLREI